MGICQPLRMVLGGVASTHANYFFPLALNVVTQILFDHPHGHHSTVTKCLNHLERRHQPIPLDSFKHNVQFVACLL